MSNTKKRAYQHIMEEKSLAILKDTLPEEWVVREYRPDYGIDLMVEIFKFRETSVMAESLGEFFLVQLKSVKKAKRKRMTVYGKFNVEKAQLKKDKKNNTTIEVIKFQVETTLLTTVQSMGSGVPVLLILVSLEEKRVFFICLNDYIDKVLLPADPKYGTKTKKTISIPVSNEIKEVKCFIPLKFYAKRSKLYAAFLKFNYQFKEVNYLGDFLYDAESFRTIKHFLSIIKRYDFWDDTEMWPPIKDCYKELATLESYFDDSSTITKNETQLSWKDQMSKAARVMFDDLDEEEQDLSLKLMVQSLWNRLSNLSNVYEEYCREWYLPTLMATKVCSLSEKMTAHENFSLIDYCIPKNS